MKRKIVALFLALLMTAGMTTSVYARDFSEVTVGRIPEGRNEMFMDGETHDLSGTGTVCTVSVAGQSTVIVDEIEKPEEDGHPSKILKALSVVGDSMAIVNGDVKVFGTDPHVAVELIAATANIGGNIVVTGGDRATYATMCSNGGIGDVNGRSNLFVGGNVSVKSSGPAVGLGVSSTYAHISGNMTVEGDEMAVAIASVGDDLVFIDGVITVKSETGPAYVILNRKGVVNNSMFFLNKVVVDSDYDNAIQDVEESDEFVLPNRANVFYLINTDDCLSTNAGTYSPMELEDNRYYANAGEVVIVSSNDSRVIGIKNADESIDLNITDNGDGTWSITVPENGGVDIQAVFGNTGDVSDNDPIDDVSEDDASAHINDTASATIMAALSGGFPVSENATMVPGVGAVTVSENAIYIVSSSCGYFDRGDLTNMSSMPKDVYITFVYDGRTYRYMIPANTDLTQFANEEGYAGYLYLSEMFGRYEIIDGVAVLVIPAKAKLQ